MDGLHEMLDLWHQKRAEGLTEVEIRKFMQDLREIDYATQKGNYSQEFWDWVEAGFPGLPDDDSEPYDEVAENQGAEWVS